MDEQTGSQEQGSEVLSAATDGPGQRRRGVPVWAAALIAILAAALAGGAVYALMSAGARETAGRLAVLDAERGDLTARLDRLDSETASLTAQLQAAKTTTSAPGTSATTGTASPVKPVSKPVRQFCLVKKVTWTSSGGYRITVDYADLLTGQAAADAAGAAGAESPPPNDYWISNTNPKLRTFALADAADVRVLGWGGGDATAKTKLPVGQFMDVMPGGTDPQDPWMSAYYYITIANGTTVTKVEQQFFP